ncbi:MAG: glutaminyl-peptide cyclotransferase [Cellvibrionaceae bacterium]
MFKYSKKIDLQINSKRVYLLDLIIVSIFFSISSHCFSQTLDKPLKINSCQVLDQQPHDTESFTQGFVRDDNFFYESSGQYSASYISKYPARSIADNDLKTSANEVIKVNLPRNIFAEGLTLFNDNLYLITWKKGRAYQLDKNTLNPIKTFRYNGEGWGLTHNSHSLIMSDGSHLLRYYTPGTFTLEKTLSVQLNNKPLKDLNELEFHNGIIWANKWHSDAIYGIEEKSGKVVTIINCQNLKAIATTKDNSENVLNGIAYDAGNKGLWVTGKYWHSRFLIEIPDLTLNH